MGYWIYILHSKSADKYYVGQSKNPSKRLEFHNTIEKGYTSKYRPRELVFTKGYNTRSEAISFERLIKSWKNKEKIHRLINGKLDL